MAFEPLDWYCRPVANGVWTKAVEYSFGAYTPCAVDSVVISISYLILLGLCIYRIWLIYKDFKVKRFRLRSNIYNYLLGLLALYCVAEPLYRLIMGVSVLNLDGQTQLAPFEMVSLIIVALAWCSMLILIGVETKVYIRELRWFGERNPNILSKSRFLESKSRFRTYSSTQSRFRTYCCCFFCLCSTTESVPLQTAFRSRKVLEDGCCGGHSTSCC